MAQKALPPNPYLVQYLGSSHTRTPKGGHEVFILMEFCAGELTNLPQSGLVKGNDADD